MSGDGYDRYKPIRNDIRQFNAESLFLITVKHLNEIFELPPHEWASKGMSPWELLLLVKWTLFEANKSGHIEPKYRDFARIVNKIKDFNDDLGVEEGSKHRLEKFFRKMAFQQFWLQSGQVMNSIRLGRTIELFLNTTSEFDLDAFLVREIGLNRKDFFDLAFITWVKVNEEKSQNKFLTVNFFSTIKDLEQEKVIKFFDAISLDWEGAQELARDMTANISFELQKFEQTPFKMSPFIRTSKGLLCYCPIIFTDFLENFFYDFAKRKSSGAFNEKFGFVFESYVGRGVRIISENCLNESEIKQRYRNKKSVDYLIEASNGNLLVECKAIELSPYARVNPSDEVLEKNLKDSIIKSIAQSIEVITAAQKSANKPQSNDYYILIVTYKELYLGNGEIAWDEFIRDAVRKEYPDHDISVIDPEKLFFASIHDFDRVAHKYGGKGEDLILKLQSITDLKTDPRDRKYVFGMYFDEPSEDVIVPLKETFDDYFNHWKERLLK